MSKHYINEVGTEFVLDCGVNLGSSAVEYIKYKTPSGSTGTWSADVYNSYSSLAGATGTYLIKHTLVSTDLSESGEWKFQAFIAASDGTWWGETVSMNIYGAFE